MWCGVVRVKTGGEGMGLLVGWGLGNGMGWDGVRVYMFGMGMIVCGIGGRA